MRKITINNAKGIKYMEFNFPIANDVYLLVGANGAGKQLFWFVWTEFVIR